MNDAPGEPSAVFEFAPEFLAEVKAIIAKYPDGCQASAVIPVLDVAQRQNGGWLPRSAMNKTAEVLGMPPIRVYEVATFYTMFNLTPIGRYHVQVCTNLPCMLRGSETIVDVCKRVLGIEVGETTEDGLFTLSQAECLGACVNAPMMQINDDYFEDLDENSTENVLLTLKMGNTPIAGPQNGRKGCEAIGGLTTLRDFVGGADTHASPTATEPPGAS
jgi:NADH-quinone oxidoreductase E subunit